MKLTLRLSLLLVSIAAPIEIPASISVELQFGAIDAPAGSLGVLVADTGGNGFESPSRVTGVPLVPGSTLGTDDVIVATFSNTALSEWGIRRGFAEHFAEIGYSTLGVVEGQSLLLYIFPDRDAGDPIRTGEPHVSYRTDDSSQFTANSSMEFTLPADGGAYLLALLEADLGGSADLATVDIAPAPVTDGSGQFARVLGPTERHTHYFEADANGFLSISGNGGPGLRAELYHRDGQLIATSDGTLPFFFEEEIEAGWHTLILYRTDGGGGQLPYQVRFDPDYIRFVQPDVAIGASPQRLVSGGTFYAPGSSIRLTSKSAKRVNGFASVANLGERPERLAVRGRRGSAFFRVRYSGIGGNITGALIRGNHLSSMIDKNKPGERLRAAFIPQKKKLRKSGEDKITYMRKAFACLIHARSTSDPSRYDGGWFRVQVR